MTSHENKEYLREMPVAAVADRVEFLSFFLHSHIGKLSCIPRDNLVLTVLGSRGSMRSSNHVGK